MSSWVNSRLASWRMSTAAFMAVVAFVALSAACGGSDPTPTVQATSAPTSTSVPAATAQPVEKVTVVTSTSIFEDWVREVGGDRVTVSSLVPRQADPHSFRPGARDIAAVADADVVFINGLGLEGSWIEDLVRNAAKNSEAIVELTDGVATIPFSAGGDDHDEHEDEHGDEDGHGHDDDDADEHDEDEDGHGHDEDEDEHGDEDEDGHAHDEDEDGDHDADDHDEDGDEHGDEDEDGHGHDEDGDEHHDEDEDGHGDEHDGHDHGSIDPHFWLDPILVKTAIETIEHELSERSPASSELFHERADAYTAKLDELDAWITQRVASIPAASRALITTHDSFGYFAKRYNFEVVGAVIPGGGTEVDPSPTELTALAEVIRDHGVGVIFSEAQLSDSLAQTLASEAGATVVGGLYTGSLGGINSPAASYEALMRNNADVIANALSGQ